MEVKTKHGIFEMGEINLGKEFYKSLGTAIDEAIELQRGEIFVSVWPENEKPSKIHVSLGDDDFIQVGLFSAIKEGFEVSDPEDIEWLAKELRNIADYIDSKIKHEAK
ncbi:MAG: hypothetical protein ABIJ57_16605 [Pseudomonadota bacterium]